MMRKLSFGLLFLLVAATSWAGMPGQYLPESTHYQGRNSFAVNEGDGKYLVGHVEFAVYDTQEQTLAGYEGDGRYVYAYQVFSYSSSTAPLSYFSLLGANFSGIVQKYDDVLDGAASGGVTASGTRLADQGAKAIWDFTEGTLVESERSWFLFFSSDADWTKGDFEVKATFDDDIPIPEPITLGLLGGGILLMRRKRK